MALAAGCCPLPGEDVPDRGFQNKAQQDVHCSLLLPFFFFFFLSSVMPGGEKNCDPVIPALLPGIPVELGMV